MKKFAVVPQGSPPCLPPISFLVLSPSFSFSILCPRGSSSEDLLSSLVPHIKALICYVFHTVLFNYYLWKPCEISKIGFLLNSRKKSYSLLIPMTMNKFLTQD